ncbi:MAG: aldo/keto reductase [Nitrospinota bacterium]
MDYRILGKTGLRLSAVGFGGMPVAGIFGAVDDSESVRAVCAALDAGITFIDTSDAYGEGRGESVIARALREWRGDRSQVVVTTKGGNDMRTGKRNFEVGYISQCIEGSLKRLGVDSIDLYQLHNPSVKDLQSEELFGLLERRHQEGKLKHCGVSINTPEEAALAANHPQVESIQVEYNLLEQWPEQECFPLAQKNNIGIIARVPYKRGLLTGKFGADWTFGEDDRRARMFKPEDIRRIVGTLDRLRQAVAEVGLGLAEAALRFCLSHPAVAAAIPGIRTAEQARQNAAWAGTLPEATLRELRELAAGAA